MDSLLLIVTLTIPIMECAIVKNHHTSSSIGCAAMPDFGKNNKSMIVGRVVDSESTKRPLPYQLQLRTSAGSLYGFYPVFAQFSLTTGRFCQLSAQPFQSIVIENCADYENLTKCLLQY